jgi:hypothetical protein
MRREWRWFGLAVAFGALVLAAAGCSKVTGGGGFSADGTIDPTTAGDACTFGFNAQPTDAAGDAKGQLQFVDHSFQGVGLEIHAALNITAPPPNPPAVAGYAGNGTASVTYGGASVPGNWSVAVVAIDNNPDYVVIVLFQDDTPVLAWSGPVTNGNITVH